MKQRGKCSLIIITRNRPNRLRRLLDYYSRHSLRYSIVIADCSSEENKLLNRNSVSSFTNLHIRHLYNYPSSTDLFQKMSDVVNYVNTEYSVFCADDDFITPKGISQSVCRFSDKQSRFYSSPWSLFIVSDSDAWGGRPAVLLQSRLPISIKHFARSCKQVILSFLQLLVSNLCSL
ncbi:MAG: TIGR00180 family glycosyltransferase [Planctomycetota bacterium]|jgi:glycosyltransferase domain-containing protein